ncbi:MAG: dihydrodipicolinate synthase family protein [Bacteroidetes bacterium]|nr:dihydrodipicolinate synthase family protein [Bacteroidota bacterium]
MDLAGIFPPLPTPFIDDEIAVDKLKMNIDKLNNTNLSGYVVMGSNGESVYLSMKEKIELVSKVKEYASGNKKIIAGTGLESIKDTIKLTNEAADAGADCSLILTPSYYKSKMTHNAFVEYFYNVADEVKIPVLIYNVPKFTGVDIETGTVAKLADHKNIIGIKNSSENIAQLAEIIYSTPDDFITLVGTASVIFSGMSIGAKGAIAALANIAPYECLKIFDLFNSGKIDESLSLQFKMLALNKAVTAKYGVPGLKKAMDLLGYFGGNPRKPLPILNEIETQDLKNILASADILTV